MILKKQSIINNFSTNDMMYSKADVIEMFDKLKDQVSYNMETELAYYINMNCKSINI